MYATCKSTFGLRMLLVLLVACCAAELGIAQESTPQQAPVIENPSTGSSAKLAAVQAQEIRRDPLTSFFEKSLNLYEFWLVIIIVLMSMMSIVCVTFMVARNKSHQPRDIWLPAIVFSIIGAILISVTAGFKNEQIGPAFGLFGTMIGYLLRSLSGSVEDGESSVPPPATRVTRTATAAGSVPPAASAGGANE